MWTGHGEGEAKSHYPVGRTEQAGRRLTGDGQTKAEGINNKWGGEEAYLPLCPSHLC